MDQQPQKPVTASIPASKSASTPVVKPAPTAPAKQPTFTSQNTAPKPPVATVVEIPDSMIEARPLTLPGSFNIKLKNPNLAARGINYVVQRGQRLLEAKVIGYRTATQQDIESAPGWGWLDNAYRMGDLLLMVMDRRQYVGAMKFNEQTSLQKASRKAISRHGQQEIHGAVRANVQSTVQEEYVAPRVTTFDPVVEMTEDSLEKIISTPGQPLVDLPQDLYGRSDEADPRIINKSKVPIPGE